MGERRGRYGVQLDRALSLATGVVVVMTFYFLLTERLLPSLRGEPVLVPEGGTLTDSFAFRPLGAGERTFALKYVPDERPVLLLVFDSTCPACYANLESWQLAIEAAGSKVTVLAVALERELSAGA